MPGLDKDANNNDKTAQAEHPHVPAADKKDNKSSCFNAAKKPFTYLHENVWHKMFPRKANKQEISAPEPAQPKAPTP